MQTRRIASLEVSVVGLGCNNFGGRLDEAQTAKVVHAALDAGITLFDTADIDGKTRSEELLGRALGARRSEIVLATKFGMAVDAHWRGAKPKYVRQALDASLRRLGTDHVDLYQLHTPDPSVPIADTLGALDELVKAGKVREIGCSNFSAEQMREARDAVSPGAAHFVSVQNEYSLFHCEPERDVLAECEREGLAFIPFFPLASGLLTGKYRRGRPAPHGSRLESAGEDALSEQRLETVESLIAFAAARGHTILELAFAFLLRHAVVASVIAGATLAEQVRSNTAAGSAWHLTDADLIELDAIVAPSGVAPSSADGAA